MLVGRNVRVGDSVGCGLGIDVGKKLVVGKFVGITEGFTLGL